MQTIDKTNNIVTGMSEIQEAKDLTLSPEIEQKALSPLGQELNSADERRIAQIESSVSLLNTRSRTFFADAPMKRFSDLVGESLNGISTRQAGEGGELIVKVKNQLRSLRLDKARKEAMTGKDPGVLSRLPMVGKWFSAFQYMRDMAKDVEKHLEQIEQEANINIGQLEASIDAEDLRYEATEEAIRDIGIYLVAGQRAYGRMKEEFLIEHGKKISSVNALELSNLRNMRETLDSFSRNLLEVRLAYEDAIQSIPNIRMGQKAALIEIQTQLATIYRRLPAIKGMIRTICTFNQISKSNLNAQAAVDVDIMLRATQGKVVHDGYIAAIKSEGNYAAQITSFADAAEQQIQTINEAIGLQQQNRTQRETDLKRIETVHNKWIDAMRKVSTKGL